MMDQQNASTEHEYGLSRRRFLSAAGVGAAGMALGCRTLGSMREHAGKRRPNVIVIFSDDHGYGSMSCMPNWNIPTPNIDSIAANGVRFTDGYVTCPICGPSRAGLLTGRYQQRFGFEENSGPIPKAPANYGLPLDEKTLADYMKELGYVTGMVGKWHLGLKPEYHPQKRGFDEFYGFLHGAHSYIDAGFQTDNPILRGTERVDEKAYLTDAFAREAVSFIDRHQKEPFFLYVPFNAVHSPNEAPGRFKGKFPNLQPPVLRTWAGMLAAMDEAVGKILDKVRETGLEEETLIFFLGDNGGVLVGGVEANYPLRGRKAEMYEGGIRIPFLVQWKGHLPNNTLYEKPASSLDILPTAVALAGGKPASNTEGVNLLPYLTGENTGTPHERLFWRWFEKSAARVGDWKLVREGDGSQQLFNLSTDLGETTDLSASRPDKLKEIQDAYDEWNARNVAPKWRDSRRKTGQEYLGI